MMKVIGVLLIVAVAIVFWPRSSPPPKADPAKVAEAEAHRALVPLERLILEARHFMSDGQYSKAEPLLAELVERESEKIEFVLQLADAQAMQSKMEAAIATYDKAIEIQPDLADKLWQRGIALYYAGRFEEGKQQFAIHQNANSQDVENAVWHMACAAKADGLEAARANLIEITQDRRVPMAEIHKLFSGNSTPEQVLETAEAPAATFDQTMHQKYYANLYIGLYEDIAGNSESAMNFMKKAEEFNPIPKQIFMGQIAKMHMGTASTENE